MPRSHSKTVQPNELEEFIIPVKKEKLSILDKVLKSAFKDENLDSVYQSNSLIILFHSIRVSEAEKPFG